MEATVLITKSVAFWNWRSTISLKHQRQHQHQNLHQQLTFAPVTQDAISGKGAGNAMLPEKEERGHCMRTKQEQQQHYHTPTAVPTLCKKRTLRFRLALQRYAGGCGSYRYLYRRLLDSIGHPPFRDPTSPS